MQDARARRTLAQVLNGLMKSHEEPVLVTALLRGLKQSNYNHSMMGLSGDVVSADLPSVYWALDTLSQSEHGYTVLIDRDPTTREPFAATLTGSPSSVDSCENEGCRAGSRRCGSGVSCHEPSLRTACSWWPSFW
jgi:hypothetical protein